jgi:hypothetical protein
MENFYLLIENFEIQLYVNFEILKINNMAYDEFFNLSVIMDMSQKSLLRSSRVSLPGRSITPSQE